MIDDTMQNMQSKMEDLNKWTGDNYHLVEKEADLYLLHNGSKQITYRAVVPDQLLGRVHHIWATTDNARKPLVRSNKVLASLITSAFHLQVFTPSIVEAIAKDLCTPVSAVVGALELAMEIERGVL